MGELNHHDGDGWQSYIPRLNMILMNGFVKPGTLKISYIKLLRDERPCETTEAIHALAPLSGHPCPECRAAI